MSAFLKLDWRDAVKGLFVAFATGMSTFVLTMLQRMVDTQHFSVQISDFQTMVAFGAMAAVGYLVKQLLTDENGKLGGHI